MTRALLVALLVVPLLTYGCARGIGYEAERPDKYEPSPEQRVAEGIVNCRKAGMPNVRLTYEVGKTHLRCGAIDFVVYERRAP